MGVDRLGIAALVFAYMELWVIVPMVGFVVINIVIYRLFLISYISVLLTFVFTVVGPHKDSKGVVTPARVLLIIAMIIGNIYAFGLLVHAIHGTTILGFLAEFIDDLGYVHKTLATVFPIWAVAGLALILIIWAVVERRKFVYGKPPLELPIVNMKGEQ